MAVLDFPISPILGDTYYPGNGNRYTWDSVKWVASTTEGPEVILHSSFAPPSSGGSTNVSGWNERNFNTLFLDDSDILVSFNTGTGVFVLAAGDYYYECWGVFFHSNDALLRIYNVTDAAELGISHPCYADNSSGPASSSCEFHGYFTVGSAKDLEVEYEVANGTGSGLGTTQPDWGQSAIIFAYLHLKRVG